MVIDSKKYNRLKEFLVGEMRDVIGGIVKLVCVLICLE